MTLFSPITAVARLAVGLALTVVGLVCLPAGPTAPLDAGMYE
jgi:hypothetical protein